MDAQQPASADHPVVPVRTEVPCAWYMPVRTGCYSRSSLCSPWARGLGGPCARGRLEPPVELLFSLFLVHMALGWFSFSLVMLLSFLVMFLFIPKEA